MSGDKFQAFSTFMANQHFQDGEYLQGERAAKRRANISKGCLPLSSHCQIPQEIPPICMALYTPPMNSFLYHLAYAVHQEKDQEALQKQVQ